MSLNLGEILRSAQNDKIIYFFRNLFSLFSFDFHQSCKIQTQTG